MASARARPSQGIERNGERKTENALLSRRQFLPWHLIRRRQQKGHILELCATDDETPRDRRPNAGAAAGVVGGAARRILNHETEPGRFGIANHGDVGACIEQPVHPPSVDGERQQHAGLGHLSREARRRVSDAHVRAAAEHRAHVLEIVARLSFEHLIDESARVGVPTSPQIHRQAIVAFIIWAGSILRRR